MSKKNKLNEFMQEILKKQTLKDENVLKNQTIERNFE